MPIGTLGVARGADGGLVADETPGAAGVRFCVDRRGVWLMVGEGTGGVHVNGRPVLRMAMLRPGDSVHAEGGEIVLAGRTPAAPSGHEAGPRDPAPAEPRMVLRGVGGHYHGRSFTLDRPRTVGREAGCDIRIDDPAFPARHCRVGIQDGAVVLRDLGSEEGSLVNGHPVRDAVLHPGDQLVFDAHQRFVVEAPGGALSPPLPAMDATGGESPGAGGPAAHPDPSGAGSVRRLPWLLLAALLLAASLAALFLYGSTG